MTEKRYYVLNSDKFGMNDSPYSYDMSDAIDEMNRLHEENKELKEKIDIMADAFAQSNDLIEVEQVFYTKVYEPSEHYDEETLSRITNALLGSDGE